jgi:hypothetical protein
MIKIIRITFLFLFSAHYCLSQISDGTVKSLVNSEEYLNSTMSLGGIKTTFLKSAATDCILLKPNPINAKKYYSKQENTIDYLYWKPEFAMISKSGDFGFTTGPYIFRSNNHREFVPYDYGRYISVWKTNTEKEWKIVLEGRFLHLQSDTIFPLIYQDPSDYQYPKKIGPQKINWRKDIVFNTDLILGKSLKLLGNKDLNEFYDPKVRLYFPGKLPIIGKKEAIQFFNSQSFAINSNPTFADRALSGDLAYTYGKANIAGKKYSYIRIWQIDQEMKWNIIIDAYLP